MQETPQQYIERMLGLVSGKDPLDVQRETAKEITKLIRPLSKKQLSRRPEPGKWSITEILAHLADSEIVLGWRMRLMICQNGALIQATDQDTWAQTLNYQRHDPKISLETFRVLCGQSAHAHCVTQGTLGKLRDALGARQGDPRPHCPHVRRPRPEPLGAMEKIAKDGGSKRAA
jgi:DinB superfamily